jgi:Fur family zinc uptake transcriptional regulator
MARGRRRHDEITPRDRLVLDCLRAKGGPMTAYDLIDTLREDGLSAPPSVYRVLARLAQRGMIHRLQSLNAYVACSHDHHAGVPVFTICETCGGVAEFDEGNVALALTQTAGSSRFAMNKAAIEISGLCATCATSGSTSPPEAGQSG